MDRSYLLVPAAFLAHTLEELPRFPAWATRRFGTTSTRFYVVSHLTLLIPMTLKAGRDAARDPDDPGAVFRASAVAAGYGFNALFHIAASALFREYSPGLATGTTLMLPASLGTLAKVRRDGAISDEQLLGSIVAGMALCTAAVGSLYLDMPTLGDEN